MDRSSTTSGSDLQAPSCTYGMRPLQRPPPVWPSLDMWRTKPNSSSTIFASPACALSVSLWIDHLGSFDDGRGGVRILSPLARSEPLSPGTETAPDHNPTRRDHHRHGAPSCCCPIGAYSLICAPQLSLGRGRLPLPRRCAAMELLPCPDNALQRILEHRVASHRRAGLEAAGPVVRPGYGRGRRRHRHRLCVRRLEVERRSYPEHCATWRAGRCPGPTASRRHRDAGRCDVLHLVPALCQLLGSALASVDPGRVLRRRCAALPHRGQQRAHCAPPAHLALAACRRP